MSVLDLALDQTYLDDVFDCAERYEQGIADLAARARLACATVTLCTHFVDSIRCAHAVTLRGGVVDVARAGRVIDTHYADTVPNFIRAWRNVADQPDRLHVAETAVAGFVEELCVAADVRSRLRAMLLDYTVGAARLIRGAS